jgi:hypothetical protein
LVSSSSIVSSSSSSFCEYCSRCYTINFAKVDASYRYKVYQLEGTCDGTGTPYGWSALQQTGASGAPDDDAGPVYFNGTISDTSPDCTGTNIWLGKEHSGTSDPIFGVTWLTDTCYNAIPFGPDDVPWWHVSICCKVVWVDSLTAPFTEYPEGNPSAIYQASKIRISLSLRLIDTFSHTFCDNSGNEPPQPSEDSTIGVSANSDFVGTGYFPSCAPMDLDIDLNNTSGCLASGVPTGFANVKTGPAAGDGWCPSPSMGFFSTQYETCEEAPCAYIGDDFGGWIPFQSCPNINGKNCTCNNPPQIASKYAGELYVTNCK